MAVRKLLEMIRLLADVDDGMRHMVREDNAAV
jgi:hypothetical protein